MNMKKIRQLDMELMRGCNYSYQTTTDSNQKKNLKIIEEYNFVKIVDNNNRT